MKGLLKNLGIDINLDRSGHPVGLFLYRQCKQQRGSGQFSIPCSTGDSFLILSLIRGSLINLLEINKNEVVSKRWHNLFLCTKPRLSQARALLLPKVFVSLGIKFFVMAKLHFRPYIPNQTVLFPGRIDENIAANDPVRMVDLCC